MKKQRMVGCGRLDTQCEEGCLKISLKFLA